MAKTKKVKKISEITQDIPEKVRNISEEVSDSPKEVAIRYKETNQYRLIYVEGVFGGISPNGKIMMSVFSESAPTPAQVVYKLTPDKKLGREIQEKRIEYGGVTRNLEARLIMEVSTAKGLIEWLQNCVNKLE